MAWCHVVDDRNVPKWRHFESPICHFRWKNQWKINVLENVLNSILGLNLVHFEPLWSILGPWWGHLGSPFCLILYRQFHVACLEIAFERLHLVHFAISGMMSRRWWQKRSKMAPFWVPNMSFSLEKPMKNQYFGKRTKFHFGTQLGSFWALLGPWKGRGRGRVAEGGGGGVPVLFAFVPPISCCLFGISLRKALHLIHFATSGIMSCPSFHKGSKMVPFWVPNMSFSLEKPMKNQYFWKRIKTHFGTQLDLFWNVLGPS